MIKLCVYVRYKEMELIKILLLFIYKMPHNFVRNLRLTNMNDNLGHKLKLH